MNRTVCCEIRRTLAAELNAIEDFILEFRAECRCFAERAERFGAELLLREMLTNAVLHGCQGDPLRQAWCAVRIRKRQFTIAVGDDGAGFDWRAAAARATEDSGCSGRGMEIFRRYATRVRFNRNGNAVITWKRF